MAEPGGHLLAIHQAGLPVFASPCRSSKAGGLRQRQQASGAGHDQAFPFQAMPKPDDAADAIAIALCHARSATSLLARAEKQAER